MRWLYHLFVGELPPGDAYTPASLATEGFVHCSYRDAAAESARLYFRDRTPRVLRIDPRRIEARVEEADTPRGPMPHVVGPIPRRAIVEVMSLNALAVAPDEVLDDA